MLENQTEILIIGGGIAGCIAAISLSKHYRIVLIDKLENSIEKIGESLAPASTRILKELNLLDNFESKSGVLYRENMGMKSYWGSNDLEISDHIINPDGASKSLNRKDFEQYLRNRCEESNVACFWGTTLSGAKLDNEIWNIKIKSQAKEFNIQADFVIDATGRKSSFARYLGVKRQIVDKLVACWIKLPNTRGNKMSTIVSAKNGWWYSAVIPNNQRVIAFHTDADLVDKNILTNKKHFLDFIKGNKIINDLLECKEDQIEFKGTVSANTTKLEQVAGDKWVAVGDAAISFDPLSSQGMFHAMASTMQLRKLILTFDTTLKVSNKYTDQINQIWGRYLQHKHLYYNMEKRWLDSEFWKRRMG